MKIAKKIDNAKDRVSRFWFDLNTKNILLTPPLKSKGSSPTIVSLVRHKDVMMYLLAVKSFYSRLQKGKIIVLDDGSLTRKDKNRIKSHVSPSDIISVNDINNNDCPSYACWERLLFIADYVNKDYIIQLDSDTITLGPVEEIGRFVNANKSFILGECIKDQKIKHMTSFADKYKENNSTFVQILAEKRFYKIRDCEKYRYVRGSAGFTGYAKESFTRKDIEHFSGRMQEILGKEKWSEWGSEQVTTNFIIANAQNAEILPYPRYALYYPRFSEDYKKTTFFHFIGTHRFAGGMYLSKAKDILSCLSQTNAKGKP